MANIYTPGMGFAQSTYVDQMATALPGALAYASDERLVDSAVVDTSVTGGLVAGVGVVLTPIPEANRVGARPGLNNFVAKLPETGATEATFGGIVVRNQQMETNGLGQACWFPKRMCNVLRSDRVGGRVWGRLVSGASVVDGPVYWVIADTAGTGKTIGGFAGAAVAGDTVELTNAKFKSVADASTGEVIVLIEIGEIPEVAANA